MRLFPELPLLRRELTELANRRRTYGVRVAAAMIGLLLLYLAYSSSVESRMLLGRSRLIGWQQLLGIGGEIFTLFTPALFYAIQLLMPALCCASVTAEKENNTIGTLLLTRLSPATIIIEKLGSRLVPMLTILLVAFPVLAFVFSLGGVDTNMLIATLWLLLCECLLFASIALLYSVWFSTTVAAFIASYTTIGFLAAMNLGLDLPMLVPSEFWNRMVLDTDGWMMAQAYLMSAVPIDASPYISAWVDAVLASQPSLRGYMAGYPWMIVVIQSLPVLLFSGFCLTLARFLLVPRAFVSRSSLLLRLFRKVDSFFQALNDRTTGGIQLVADSNALPVDKPVAWRERAKKSLGKIRYLFRILTVIEVPTAVICALTAIESSQTSFSQLYVLELVVWLLALLVVSVKGATLFSSERARETLEPLLASPMLAVELVGQKISGMHRLLLVMATPILTVNLTIYYLNLRSGGFFLSSNQTALNYLLMTVLAVFTLLYITAWLTTGIGLYVHSQTKAVLVAVSLIAAWALLPFILTIFFWGSRAATELFLISSPASLIIGLEAYVIDYQSFLVDDGEMQIPALASCIIRQVFYGFVLVFLILVVRRISPRLLNRLEADSEPKLISSRPLGSVPPAFRKAPTS